MNDAAKWLSMTPEEQAEMRNAHSQTGDHLKTMLFFAQVCVETAGGFLQGSETSLLTVDRCRSSLRRARSI